MGQEPYGKMFLCSLIVIHPKWCQCKSYHHDIRTSKLWRLLFPRLSLFSLWCFSSEVPFMSILERLYFLFCNNKRVSCQASGELAYEFGEHLIFVNNTLRRRCTLCLEKGRLKLPLTPMAW
jgi:hypothetical protein